MINFILFIMKLNYKKSQINQVFVYLTSIILILFVGFLVYKFVASFNGSVNTKIETQIYKDLKNDFISVYQTYGSQKVLKYKLTQDVKQICFVSKQCDTTTLTNLNNDEKDSLKQIINSGNNIALFSNDGIINSHNIGKFTPTNNCFCAEPKNEYIKLIMENNKNVVYISEYK